jgi:hypothetical protein
LEIYGSGGWGFVRLSNLWISSKEPMKHIRALREFVWLVLRASFFPGYVILALVTLAGGVGGFVGGMALIRQEGGVQIVIALVGAVVGGLVGLLVGSPLAVVLQEGWPLQLLPRRTSWIVALAVFVGGLGGFLGGMALLSQEGVVRIVTAVVGGLVGIYLGYRVAWRQLDATRGRHERY